MPLEWSAHKPPDEECRYDHIEAHTPVGLVRIEWKGWKKYDTPICHLPFDVFIYGNDVEDTKANVEKELRRLGRGLIDI